MTVFLAFAGLMVALHLVAGLQRPRLAVIGSGLLWLLYAAYERLMATGVLCDAGCIRVDLVFFLPVLGVASLFAYQSYMGQPTPWKVIGTALGAIAVLVLLLLAADHGYGALAGVVILAVLAIGLYAINAKSKTNRP